MDISSSTLQYIESVIDTAGMVGIDSVIIEPDRVRGMSTDTEVFMLHTDNVPELEFNAVGINRLSVFKSRYNMVKLSGCKFTALTHTIEIEQKPFMFARSIKMQNKRIDLDFRCANPITIRSPKKVLDEITYKIDNIDSLLEPLTKGFQAMGEDSLYLLLDSGTLSFKLSDENGDAFNYIIAEDCYDEVAVGVDAPTEFAYQYHIKVLLPILRKLSSQTIYITSNGMIKANVNNFDVYLKPVDDNV